MLSTPTAATTAMRLHNKRYSLLVLIAMTIVLHSMYSNSNKFSMSISKSAQTKPLTRPLQLLSIDFHISPIADLKDVFGKFFPATVHDFSLSGACEQMGTCARGRIKIKEDLSSLYLTQEARESFYNAYSQPNSLINKMDAMICSHPSGMCELIMPFNKTVILWITTRFEQGREGDAQKMRGLIKNFKTLAKRPDTSILANNMYDVQYFNYFTGITPTYIPSFCDYTGARWESGNNTVILVHGYRPRRNGMPASEFLAPLRSLVSQYDFHFIRSIYPGHYSYTQIARHPAILHIPYQVSIMSFFEHYRMCIPILAPSVQLLTEWHMIYHMVSERTWDMALHSVVARKSVLPRDVNSTVWYDPNDELDSEAVMYWLQFSDFYSFPHVILFDSWEHLAKRLKTVDFADVSRKMCDHNAKELTRIAAQWEEVLGKVQQSSATTQLSYTQAMDAVYGVEQWAGY